MHRNLLPVLHTHSLTHSRPTTSQSKGEKDKQQGQNHNTVPPPPINRYITNPRRGGRQCGAGGRVRACSQERKREKERKPDTRAHRDTHAILLLLLLLCRRSLAHPPTQSPPPPRTILLLLLLRAPTLSLTPPIPPLYSLVLLSLSTAWNASWGTWTFPMVFMRFLPFACFCSSFFFRLTSPP